MNANVKKMNAEDLEFPDGYFDVIFGLSILHYLNLEMVLRNQASLKNRIGSCIYRAIGKKSIDKLL
jgi:2-polyprenyl-3-methyl-5-hydroxy-6-metoxy-1,4-benzoquinol methylase